MGAGRAKPFLLMGPVQVNVAGPAVAVSGGLQSVEHHNPAENGVSFAVCPGGKGRTRRFSGDKRLPRLGSAADDFRGAVPAGRCAQRTRLVAKAAAARGHRRAGQALAVLPKCHFLRSHGDPPYGGAMKRTVRKRLRVFMRATGLHPLQNTVSCRTMQTLNAETVPVDSPSRKEVWKMFDRIAHRYDVLNRSLSFGRDVAWRKRLRKHLPEGREIVLVDLATGTADQILFLLNGKANIAKALGYDLSEEMLALGREKIARQGVGDVVSLHTGDAMRSPQGDSSADVITISFGIRNVEDVPTALADMRRALVPGGKLLILECSLPQQALVRKGYLFYFRHILPKLGGWVSGDSYAYNYLNKTVETFPCGEAFCALMRDAGFEAVRAEPMTFGVATLYSGVKPESAA